MVSGIMNQLQDLNHSSWMDWLRDSAWKMMKSDTNFVSRTLDFFQGRIPIELDENFTSRVGMIYWISSIWYSKLDHIKNYDDC